MARVIISDQVIGLPVRGYQVPKQEQARNQAGCADTSPQCRLRQVFQRTRLYRRSKQVKGIIVQCVIQHSEPDQLCPVRAAHRKD